MFKISENSFAAPKSGAEQDETDRFRPKFGPDGLLSVIACDAKSGEVLMMAHMNEAALHKTLETGKVHYWSRSRQKIWLKGETSGNIQILVELLADCDQDCLLLKVQTADDGAACHTGRVSCFYRRLKQASDGSLMLEFDKRAKKFDPDKVYSD